MGEASVVADVLVVGGGAIGLATAWRLAAAGVSVTLADPAPARGASWAAAGMLAPVTELEHGEEALLALNLRAVASYPTFVEELESASATEVGYRQDGTLAVAADAGDRARLAELHSFHASLGLGSEMLSSRECRALEPALAPGTRGGLFVRGDHQVDNRPLVAALQRAAEVAGVRFVRAAVSALQTRGGRVSSAALADGTRVAAGVAVLAAGARSREIRGIPPEALPPVRPVKGQILRLRGPSHPSLLRRTVRGVVAGSSVYLVPRADGRLVVGATVEEMGLDRRVTAGAVYSMLRDATSLVPGVSELELVETAAAPRPGSVDNAPLLGRTGLDGLLVATGHYRNGLLLAGVTASAIADLVIRGEVPADVEAFSPLRFSRGPEQERAEEPVRT